MTVSLNAGIDVDWANVIIPRAWFRLYEMPNLHAQFVGGWGLQNKYFHIHCQMLKPAFHLTIGTIE